MLFGFYVTEIMVKTDNYFAIFAKYLYYLTDVATTKYFYELKKCLCST